MRWLTFSSSGVISSGAGTSAVNGYYRENGANEGRPKYDQVGGSYYMYYLMPTDFAGQFWSIQEKLDNTILDAQYYSGSLTMTAPEGTWSLVMGAAPAPTVQRFAITGSTAVGATLSAQYDYSDPDGDAQAGTTFQWYRFDLVTATTGGTSIPGATSSTYTTQAADSGKFLRLQVTPGDARGQTGTPVLSGAVRIQ